MGTNAPRPYNGEEKPEAPPPPPKKVCGGEGCSLYPPVKGFHTCKYCGRKVPVYNEYNPRKVRNDK